MDGPEEYYGPQNYDQYEPQVYYYQNQGGGSVIWIIVILTLIIVFVGVAIYFWRKHKENQQPKGDDDSGPPPVFGGKWKNMGCYKIDPTQLSLLHGSHEMTVDKCKQYAGLTNIIALGDANNCYAVDNAPGPNDKSDGCTLKCSGSEDMCGGAGNTYNVWQR